MKHPLAFVHIPKCSGTSFEHYLVGHFARLGMVVRCYTGEAPGGGPESFDRYVEAMSPSPFVYGHISLRSFRQYYHDPCVITFLRDPVARTISQYKSWHDPANFNGSDPHFRVGSSEVWEALTFAQGASLEAFVNTQNAHVRANALGDLQTQYLSTYDGDDMAGHLESAKQNLQEMVYFGLTERFKDSINLFRKTFIDAPDYAVPVQAENRSRIAVQSPSPELIEAIRAQVPCDAELYRFACELIDSRMRDRQTPRVSLAEIALVCRERETSHQELARDALERENAELRAHLAQLTATYEQLAGVYRDITGSRSWWLLQAVRRLTGRAGGS